MQNRTNSLGHIPVMLGEVLGILDPQDGDLILDGTFGAGGYSAAILARNSSCRVVGIDRDENVMEFVKWLKSVYDDRFTFHNIKFSKARDVVECDSLNGLVLDLGVSSMQLGDDGRGFSFERDAKLLMTMGRNKISAYDVVNGFSQEQIASIISNYGDELKSRTIARRIFERRKIKLIETTVELADIIRSCFRSRGKIDNATRTFQAIRIFVNDELEELEIILRDSMELLKNGGRLVVVSFNSLEDRIVKRFFTENGNMRSRKTNKYGNSVDADDVPRVAFSVGVRKPLLPSREEVLDNVRSRSAKLRWGIRC
ncbi:MAG: 16S rRNA (cytosine(1402)-N(4))-methyltransferase RsmH [Rickettsiales bacterium]|nr:16S rRNA (cytosine(1402)-N(4))-methyltransferase RsmH [Rickettsiales bacterium]